MVAKSPYMALALESSKRMKLINTPAFYFILPYLDRQYLGPSFYCSFMVNK